MLKMSLLGFDVSISQVFSRVFDNLAADSSSLDFEGTNLLTMGFVSE